MLQQVESISKFGGFAVKATTAVGALFLLIYCSKLGFYPSGVTLGDTLLFIFLSLGFCFVYGILFYMLFCMGSLATPIVRWMQKFCQFLNIAKLLKKPLDPLPQVGTLTWNDLGVTLPGAIMFLIVGTLIEYDKLGFAWGLSASAITIFLWWTFILRNPWIMKTTALIKSSGNVNNEANANYFSQYKKPFAWLLYILIPIIVFQGMLGLTLNAAASLIGIRSEHVTVQVTKDRTPLIQKTLQNVPNLSSRIEVLPDGGGAILRMVDVLFQGIGNKTLIAVKTPKEEIRFFLPSQDIVIVSTVPNEVLQKGTPQAASR